MTARVVVAAGLVAIVAGVWLALGVAVALIAAGVFAVLFGLLFVNVDGGNDRGESAP